MSSYVNRNHNKKNWTLNIAYPFSEIGIESPKGICYFRKMTKLEKKLISMAYKNGLHDGKMEFKKSLKELIM